MFSKVPSLPLHRYRRIICSIKSRQIMQSALRVCQNVLYRTCKWGCTNRRHVKRDLFRLMHCVCHLQNNKYEHVLRSTGRMLIQKECHYVNISFYRKQLWWKKIVILLTYLQKRNKEYAIGSGNYECKVACTHFHHSNRSTAFPLIKNCGQAKSGGLGLSSFFVNFG